MMRIPSKAVCALMALAALSVVAIAAEEPSVGSVVVESVPADQQSPARVGMQATPTPRALEGHVVEAQVGNTVLLEEVAMLSSGQAAQPAYSSLPDSVYAKRDVSRRDFNGNQVTNDFCGGPAYYEHHKCSKEYKESLAMTASPFIGWAIASLILWLLVVIGRNCCCFGYGFFGGKYPSKGWCFGELRDSDQGYSECERRTFLGLVVIVLLVIVAGMIVGFIGNNDLSAGMDALIDITAETPHKMALIVNPLPAKVASLKRLSDNVNPYVEPKYWATLKTGLDSAVKGLEAMRKQVATSVQQVSALEDDRSTWTYSGLWIPFVLGILSIIAYLCPVLLPGVVVPLAAIMTVVLWVAVGVHVPVSVAVADFCVALHHGLAHPNASSPLDMLVGCHGETGATKMVESTKYFEHTAVHVACETLNKTMCEAEAISYPDRHGQTKSFKPVQCPKDAACKDRDSLAAFIKRTVVRDFQWGCATLASGNIVTEQCQYSDKATAKNACLKKYGNTDVMPCVPGSTEPYREVSIAQCNRTCHHTSVKDHSRTVSGNFELADSFNTLGGVIQPLANCSLVQQQAALFEHSLCWDVVSGSDYVMAGLTVIAVALLVGNFIYLSAYKRFHRKYLGDMWADERENILNAGQPLLVAAADTGQPLLGPPRGSDQV